MGQSFAGFAIREPFAGSVYHTIGWAELLLDESGVVIVDNAVSSNFDTLEPSSGITVSVPEPSSFLLSLVLLMTGMCVPRRRRSSGLR